MKYLCQWKVHQQPKNFFYYIRSRKSPRVVVDPLADQEVNGSLKDDRVIAEKLITFLAVIFSAKDIHV